MKENNKHKGLPIIVGIGTFLILGWLGHDIWTVSVGTVFMVFVAWYALNYEPETRRGQ